MADVTLSAAQKVTLRIAPKDANGVDRDVQNPTWALEAGGGDLVAAEDGKSAVYTPADSESDTAVVVRVTGDADLTDAGVKELTDTFNLTVTGVVPQATTLGLSSDAPEAK
jgi:hypothetical protein